MRALIHPAIEDVPVQAILHALSDPVRVAIYADIVKGCEENCSNFLTVGDRDIPKSTLSQHFRILREAGLIHSERKGVEMFNTSRYDEVDRHYPGLLAAIATAHAIQIRANKRGKHKQ
ncbi:MAG: helix-turn-helix domain-containing protein [Acidobacteriota bacterium]|nr:helix-turn-helix domain-containing protein [Acidobacteriota bacterium]